MTIVEITGQPCAGKTSYISDTLLIYENTGSANGTLIKKIYFFLCGVQYLKTARIRQLLKWSLKENASIFFKLNIFRNAVTKFGMFNKRHDINLKNKQNFLLDEGISHLPFLFLETDTSKVVQFIFNELQQVDVVLLKSPGQGQIKERLTKRGHKRLQFLPLSNFADRNREIEEVLVHSYANFCHDFKVK